MKLNKICIIGGGLTGLVTALQLSETNSSVELFIRGNDLEHKDQRVTALSKDNLRQLKKLCGEKLDDYIFSSNHIILRTLIRDKIKDFSLNDQGTLISIVQNSALSQLLIRKLKNKNNVKILKKKLFTLHNKIESETTNLSKKYNLVIMCVGHQPELFDQLNLHRAINYDGNEVSLTCNLKINNANKLKVQQFFFNEGPMAILPFKKNQCSLVWTIKKEFLNENKNEIKNIIQDKIKRFFGYKQIIFTNPIKIFPIITRISKKIFKNNILILGNANASIHPLAGHGFNLILRDIALLQHKINHYNKLGLFVNETNLLSEIEAKRKPEKILAGLGLNLINQTLKSDNSFFKIKDILLTQFSKNNYLKNLSKKIANQSLV